MILKFRQNGQGTRIAKKFLKIEIISSIFSDHNAMRLEMNYREKKHKKHKHMEAIQYVTK